MNNTLSLGVLSSSIDISPIFTGVLTSEQHFQLGVLSSSIDYCSNIH